MAELTTEQLKTLGWAQDATLRNLVDKVGNTNSILAKIGSTQFPELKDNLSEFDKAISESTKGLDENTKKQLEDARAARNLRNAKREIEEETKAANEKYKDSVNDLRRTLGKISSFKAEDLFAKANDGIGVWSGKLSESQG